MNYKELKKAVAEEAGTSIAAADIMLSAFKKVITESLLKGEEVVWTRFFKLESRNRKARNSINPKTRAEIKVPAKHVPHLQFAQGYKDDFNKEKSLR